MCQDEGCRHAWTCNCRDCEEHRFHHRASREDSEAVRTELLDAIEDFLDDHADAEGNGPADYRPNKAMRLLNDLREVREKGRG